MSENASELRVQIGQRVHDLRVSQRYTQAQFAETIDISVNFLSEIENGKKGMSQETIYKLCMKHHISADYLILGKDLSSPQLELSKISDVAASLSSAELSHVISYLTSLKKMKDLNL